MADTKIKYSKSFDYSKIDRGVTWRKVTANQRKKDSIGLSKETKKFSCPICFSNKNNKIIVDVDRDKGWFNLFLGNKPIIYHKILHTFGLKPKLGWVGSCREISSIEQYKY